MKKRHLSLDRKLVLQKKWIGNLMAAETGAVLGGATFAGDTSPCGPCPGPTINCPTVRNCPPNTSPTVGNPCCSISGEP
ncbi:class I lanthipeptide [Taibaiella koreensis]|uniref:class I lanthipeptide n=1 Tax=Taibaiella koreensis TaxID=1268548 RepID=UPI001969788C